MKVGLLIIGDEILNGATLDTNSNFAAKKLNDNGFKVTLKMTIGDSEAQILDSLDIMFKNVELVITTGGLGPTKDDITKYTLAKYFECGLETNPEILDYLRERYAKVGKELNDLNKTQALIPTAAIGIINPVGTAPVMWFEKGKQALATLPGVPKEMQYLIENIVIPKAKEKFKTENIIHETINVIGIPESDLAGILQSVDEEILGITSKEKYKLAYLPDFGTIKLRLTGIGEDNEVIQNQLNEWKTKIHQLAAKYVYGEGNLTISQHIQNLFIERDFSLAVAESCTGGYISHLLTLNPDSSKYFLGGVVSYSNEVKENNLGVKKETLAKFGAVSKETAEEMVLGVLKNYGSNFAIATTGIAGPGGGSLDKTMGTVWIGVGSEGKIHSQKFTFNRNRAENIHLFTISALDMLRKFISDNVEVNS